MGIYLTKKNTTTNKIEKFKVAGNSGYSYPVGSIYMSVNSTSPASMFGGTWEQIKDKFLLSAGDTYSAGATGGEATHTLTVNEMPRHSHSTWMSDGTETNPPLQDRIPLFAWNKHGQISLDTASKGGGQAHNNMPPYLVVYCWKRIG